MTNTFGDPARLPEPPPAGPFSHGRWASPIHPLPPERSARGVATGAVVTLSRMALLSLALAAARLNRATVLDDVRDGSAGFSAVRRLEDADGLVNLASTGWAIGGAATAIVLSPGSTCTRSTPGRWPAARTGSAPAGRSAAGSSPSPTSSSPLPRSPGRTGRSSPTSRGRKSVVEGR